MHRHLWPFIWLTLLFNSLFLSLLQVVSEKFHAIRSLKTQMHYYNSIETIETSSTSLYFLEIPSFKLHTNWCIERYVDRDREMRRIYTNIGEKWEKLMSL